MRLGIFGGTFNPIHIGHLRVAEEVRETLDLERIIFVPSYLPPHKELSYNVTGARRLEMVKMALQSNAFFGVSSFEVDSGGNSYSIKTIEHIRELYGCTPYFILGRDAFNEISSWYQVQRLFGLTHFVVMSRPGAPVCPLSDVLGEESARFRETPGGVINAVGNEIVFVEVTAYAVSSSKIRELCKEGRSTRYLVPEEVHDYIRKEGIYSEEVT
jgi:nicotinate-nucleotide adenylyltransferase